MKKSIQVGISVAVAAFAVSGAVAGTWPLQGGGEIHLPHPSVACYYVFELRWMTYRHCPFPVSQECFCLEV